jgi:hypothetical protein
MARDELALRRQLRADFRALAQQYPALCTPDAQERFAAYTQQVNPDEDICQQNTPEGDIAMPPRGHYSMGEEMQNIGMRLPVSVVEQVDVHVERLRKETPWAKVGRSDALRDLVLRGLATLEPAPSPTEDVPFPTAETELIPDVAPVAPTPPPAASPGPALPAPVESPPPSAEPPAPAAGKRPGRRR